MRARRTAVVARSETLSSGRHDTPSTPHTIPLTPPLSPEIGEKGVGFGTVRVELPPTLSRLRGGGAPGGGRWSLRQGAGYER